MFQKAKRHQKSPSNQRFQHGTVELVRCQNDEALSRESRARRAFFFLGSPRSDRWSGSGSL